MRSGGLVAVWVLSACACLPRPPPQRSRPPEEVTILDRVPEGEHALMGPMEVVRALRVNKGRYPLYQLGDLSPRALELYADELWPAVSAPLDMPMVEVGSGGKRFVERYPPNEAADRLIAEAEPHFRQGRWKEAAALYQRALEHERNYYPALLGLGDVAHQQGDLVGALSRHARAIDANPVDHRGHLRRANVLVDMGITSQALVSYATALSLRPRHPPVLDAIHARRAKLKVRVVRSFFLPRGLARSAGQSVDVLFDTDRPHWMVFAGCKALWIGQERHRLALTGDATHRFTPLEEVECMGALLQAYLSGRSDAGGMGEAEEELELERLGRIAANGHFPELILYELSSRKIPHAMLQVDGARRQKVEDFLLRYAFEDLEEEEPEQRMYEAKR